MKSSNPICVLQFSPYPSWEERATHSIHSTELTLQKIRVQNARQVKASSKQTKVDHSGKGIKRADHWQYAPVRTTLEPEAQTLKRFLPSYSNVCQPNTSNAQLKKGKLLPSMHTSPDSPSLFETPYPAVSQTVQSSPAGEKKKKEFEGPRLAAHKVRSQSLASNHPVPFRPSPQSVPQKVPVPQSLVSSALPPPPPQSLSLSWPGSSVARSGPQPRQGAIEGVESGRTEGGQAAVSWRSQSVWKAVGRRGMRGQKGGGQGTVFSRRNGEEEWVGEEGREEREQRAWGRRAGDVCRGP